MIFQKNVQYFIVILILLLTGFVTSIMYLKCLLPTIKLLIRGHPGIKNFEKTLLNKNVYTFIDECYSSSRIEQKILCLNYFEMVIHLGENKIYDYENINEINKAIQKLDQPDKVIDKFCNQLKKVLPANQIYKANLKYLDYFMVNDMFCNIYCTNNSDFMLYNSTRRYTRNVLCRLLLIGYDLLNNYTDHNKLIDIKPFDEITKQLSCTDDENDVVVHDGVSSVAIVLFTVCFVVIVGGVILWYSRAMKITSTVVNNAADIEFKTLSHTNPACTENEDTPQCESMEAVENDESHVVYEHTPLIQQSCNNPFKTNMETIQNYNYESQRLRQRYTNNPFEILDDIEPKSLTKRSRNNPFEIVHHMETVQNDESQLPKLTAQRIDNNPFETMDHMETMQNDRKSNVVDVRPPLAQQNFGNNPFEIVDNMETLETAESPLLTEQHFKSVVDENITYELFNFSKRELEIKARFNQLNDL